jgi:hypothetical protein
MAKTIEQLKPNYAPVYAAMYPGLAAICHKHGYALAVHGSLARDFDLIAIPWAEKISKPYAVIRSIKKKHGEYVRVIGRRGRKAHGRIAYTLSIAFGECALDFSFFPI